MLIFSMGHPGFFEGARSTPRGKWSLAKFKFGNHLIGEPTGWISSNTPTPRAEPGGTAPRGHGSQRSLNLVFGWAVPMLVDPVAPSGTSRGFESEKWKSLRHVQLCDPRDYTVHGILQAWILEWVAFPFSRGSSQPRDQSQVSCIAGRFFIDWAILYHEASKSAEPFLLWFPESCLLLALTPSL